MCNSRFFLTKTIFPSNYVVNLFLEFKNCTRNLLLPTIMEMLCTRSLVIRVSWMDSKWMYLMTSSSCCCPHKRCDLLKQSPMTSGWCCAETSPLTSRTFSSWMRTDDSGHVLIFWERPRIGLATTLNRKLQRLLSALFCITCTGGHTGDRRYR